MKWKKNMDPVDFSPVGHWLVESEDGSIQPMDQPYFKATQIAEGTWAVLSDGDHTFVLEGDDELIAIDSGSGCGNIRAFCQTLSPKPLYRLLNTHYHFDHTAQNYLFDCVYMSEKCYQNRCRPFAMYREIDFPDDYPVVFIKAGDTINLSGRELEVLGVENHCEGSLQFLDRKARILFTGDEVHGHFFDCNKSVSNCYQQLAILKKYRPFYDRICAGCGVFDAEYIDRYYEVLEYILSGHEHEGEADFPPFEDPYARVNEVDGKRVQARRCPHPADIEVGLRAAGREDLLEKNGGRAAIGMMRRLNPSGMFDRRLIRNGCTVNYYLNKIWE